MSRFQRPLVERLRRLCLALPETAETQSWGHPNFRAWNRTFCAFEIVKERPSIAFRLSRPDVERHLRRRGFFETPYGRGLWVSVWADGKVNWKQVEALLEAAYRQVAIKRPRAATERRAVARD
jgi:predicted DNA-binding protein (MmcQ/YjbR family)